MELTSDGRFALSTSELTDKQREFALLDVMVKTYQATMEVKEQMATLRERVSELQVAVQGVAERVGSGDLPALREALATAQQEAATLRETLTGERDADLAEDAAYESRIAELVSNVEGAVTEAQEASDRIAESVQTLNNVAPVAPVEPTV